MSFKDEYLKTPPGSARENLAYKAIIAQGPPKNLVPVTVDGPGGTKITYKVMPDYVMVDGVRVSMSPATAQKVATYFGMSLPTAKMSKQIYDAADTKVRATPLSGTGYVGADGKRYSAQDVTAGRIGASDAVVHYNDLTNKEIARAGGAPKLIAGHGKDILEPLGSPNDVSLGGWQGKNNEALQPWTVAHKGEAERHTEYGLWTRLVGGDVVVTTPDGKTIQTTMEKLRNSPNLSKAVAVTPGIKKYVNQNTPAVKETSTPKPAPQQVAQGPRSGLLDRIDSILSQFS